jgi:hypothetical protein
MKIPSAWQTMRAGMLTGIGKINLFMYVLFFALAILKVGLSGTEKNFIALLCWASIPSSVFWATISSKSLKLMRDTDNFLIPNVSYAVACSLLLQYCLSVVFPSLLISLVTGHFALILAIFTLSALCGLISTLINPFAGITIGILPYVFIMLDYNKLLPDKNSNDFIISLFLGALVLAFTAVWRVKSLRKADDHYELWSTPSVLAPVKGSGWDVYTFNMSEHANKQSKMIAAYLNSIISLNNIISPELALRIWMGKAFIPITLSAKIRNAILIAAAFFILPWLIMLNLEVAIASRLNHIASMSLVLISCVFLIFAVAPKLFRLHYLYKKSEAELSELPLIPAWNNPVTLRNLIKHIVLKDIGKAFLISAVLSTASVFTIQPNNIDMYIVSFIFNFCGGFLAIGYAFRTITRKNRHGIIIGLAFYFIPTISMTLLMITSIKSTSVFLKSANYMLWFICGLVCIVYFAISHRKFKSLKNPFLHI